MPPSTSSSQDEEQSSPPGTKILSFHPKAGPESLTMNGKKVKELVIPPSPPKAKKERVWISDFIILTNTAVKKVPPIQVQDGGVSDISVATVTAQRERENPPPAKRSSKLKRSRILIPVEELEFGAVVEGNTNENNEVDWKIVAEATGDENAAVAKEAYEGLLDMRELAVAEAMSSDNEGEDESGI